MTNAELISCDLAWHRDGADWALLHKRRRMGRVTPDPDHPGMYRIVLSRGRLSDMANLSWAKDGALAAATRELEWEAKHRAIRPSKPQQIGAGLAPIESPMRYFGPPLISAPSSVIANPESLTALSSAV